MWHQTTLKKLRLLRQSFTQEVPPLARGVHQLRLSLLPPQVKLRPYRRRLQAHLLPQHPVLLAFGV